ncbi:MAG: diacylglycerol kinase family lipid kinase [Saprospiraceae bacterium]
MKAPFWYIIFNPAAGGGTLEAEWPRLEACLRTAGYSYTVAFTRYKGHAIRLAEEAVLKGHRYLMAVGGDGTNHEVVNGIFKQKKVAPNEVYYALLPFGTGNDWARYYELSRDFEERLARIKKLKTQKQDLGWVRYQSDEGEQERFFVNVAGMAYDAFIAKKTEEMERRPGAIQYLLMVARYLFQYELQPARIEFDEQQIDDLFYTINIGICPYSGGGMRLVPQAVPNDGMLALTFARELPKWEVLVQTRRFYTGTILDHPKITGLNTEGPIRVLPLQGTTTLLEADGEFLGYAPAVFRIMKKGLRVVI